MLGFRPTYTPDPTPVPEIKKITPQFLSGKTVEEAVLESRENVILRVIDSLPQGELGITDTRLHEKFKATLILLAHELFLAQQKWRMQESAYLRDFIKRRYDELSKQPKAIAEAEFKSSIKNYFEARIELYPYCFSFDEKLFDDAITFAPALPAILAQTEFPPLKVELGLFDYRSLHPIIKFDTSKRVPFICQKHHLQKSEKSKIQELSHSYILVLTHFATLLVDTVHNIRTIFPEYSATTLATQYKKAFQIFSQSKFIYLDNFLHELYFQQIRKPELASEIFPALKEIYIRAVNLSYDRISLGEVVTLNQIKKWVPFYIITAQPSLQEIISVSFKNLHDTTTSLASSPSDLVHIITVVAEDEKLEPVAESKTSQAPELASIKDKTEPFPYYPKNKPCDPLFKSPVPGHVEVEDITSLAIKTEHLKKYHDLFKNLSTDPSAKKHAKDRDTARSIFSDELKKADSVEKIAALVQVAKPYINRHKNIRIDRRLGKTITNSWSDDLKEARTLALGMLQNNFLINQPAADSLAARWSRDGLFSQHRRNFRIFGAFGRTDTQNKIDGLINKKRVGR